MGRISTKIAGAVGGLTLLFANASSVLAQWDYEYDYSYGTDTGSSAGGMFVFLMYCCCGLVGLAMFAFNIWMLIHVLQNAPDDQKVLWLLLILFVPFGSVIYFFAKKKEFEGAGGSTAKKEEKKEESGSGN